MIPEVVLYMAFVSIANFAQPSFELGYALKLWRMLLVICVAVGDAWGFALGLIALAVTVCTTKTVGGKSYLYPLIPFDGPVLLRLLFRLPENWQKVAELKLIEGRPTSEVCDQLSISEKACYSRVSRIRKYIESLLKREDWP